MAEDTQNHGYPRPSRGDGDWHLPLNARATSLDTDVEVRDLEENRSNYTPKQGAKYVATDSHTVYFGDGSNWQLAGKLGGVSRDSVVVRKDNDDVTYAETTDGVLMSGTDSHKVIQAVIDQYTTDNGGRGASIVLKPQVYLLTSTLEVKPGIGLHTPQGAKFANNMPADDSSKSIIFHNNTRTERIHVDAWGKNGIQFGKTGNKDGSIRVGEVISGEIKGSNFSDGTTPIAIEIIDAIHAKYLYGTGPGQGGGIGVRIRDCTDNHVQSILVAGCGTGLEIEGETMIIQNVDIDSAGYQGINITNARNIHLAGTIWYNASTYSQHPVRGLVVGENAQCGDIYWQGMHLGHGGTGIELHDVDNFRADVLMAGNPAYMSADRGLGTGIDYSNLTGSNIVIDAAMDDAVSTRVRETPEGVLNGVAYASAGKGSAPSSNDYAPGRVVENTDDNTLWWKDSNGNVRKIV